MRASFWLDKGEDTGSVVLWTAGACGPRPVIRWRSIEDVKNLSDMLLAFYWSRKMEQLEMDEVAERIIWQAFEGK